MAFNARSTTGCWTCRLRKKKCDEIFPACSPCTSLALTCHGYGSRPEWMDGQAREREMAASVRGIVKVAASQKRRAAMLRRHQGSPSKVPNSNRSHSPPPQITTGSATHHSPQAPAEDNGIQSPTLGASRLSPSVSMDDDEASLLMHYLDHVFHLQFRFYQPSIWNGGRGWLLSTLMQTKPLYQAALSLAAYHRQASFCHGMTDVKLHCFRAEAVQEKRVLAIRELRRYLEETSTSAGCRSLPAKINVLCSVVLLLSLEVS